MRYRFLALAGALVLLGAACGDSSSEDTTGPTTAAAPVTTQASGDAGVGPSVTVTASAFGDHLTDAEGKTLYLFLPDSQGASTCYEQCEANWPVFSGEGAGDGVDGALLGTSTRTDGNPQTTFNGWPLYYFAADSGPGDINGQGVGDVWYVVAPTGDPVQ